VKKHKWELEVLVARCSVVVAGFWEIIISQCLKLRTQYPAPRIIIYCVEN